MPDYLIQASYTSDSWGSQISKPQSPVDRIKPVIEGLGGSLESVYYAFGEYDIVGVVRVPDNVSAAAFALAISAGGAAKAFRTTPLMTIEEGMEAMRKAGAATYSPPGG
jgi:uncharacterized protein with GYD domain